MVVSVIETLLVGLSISYYFTHTHGLKYSFKKSFLLFYICYLFFYVFSLSFSNHYIVRMVYMFFSLFIISHICLEDHLKKRIMMLGIFALIFIVEEMLTKVISIMIFGQDLIFLTTSIYYSIFQLCLRNMQLFGYCFFVEDLLSRQFSYYKPFYLIPIGQAILLLIVYYLGVMRCEVILGYLFIAFALLIVWCDYILYQAFLRVRIEKMTDIKYVQSKVFNQKYNELRRLKHDLMNHYSVLEIMMNNNDQQGVNEYMKKMQELYKDNTNDI